ncbi:condensation domain-containing protein [Streptomyces sp. NPDC094437]|uniref:condensation domain-containing protein n=1 Tax=Streptomyces sp. NPDC094437 TaxID=3366060 RepID=UPI00382967C2
MLMVPLPEFVPTAGELVEFQVPEEVLAAAALAPEHPAPAGELQETHLRTRAEGARAGAPPETWLGLAFDLPGRLDTAALTSALTTWLRRHSTLLTWFAPAGDGFRRHAVDPETVTFTPVSLSDHASPEEIRAHLSARFARDTDPTVWPPLVVSAVLRETGSTVHLAIDHAHTDGLSILRSFGELRAYYTAAVTGTPARLPETGSYVDFCHLDRERSDRLDADSPAVARWRTFLDCAPYPAAFDLGIKPGTTYPAAAVTVDLLDAAESTAFGRLCTAHGVDFAAGVQAAFALCGRTLGGPETYRALTLVHTRDERRWLHAHGWFVNTVPVEFPATGGTFAEVLTAAKAGLLRAQEANGVTLPGVTRCDPSLAPLLQEATQSLPLASFLDFRSLPGVRDWSDHNVTALIAMGRTRVPRFWVNRLPDRTYVRAAHPDTPEARDAVLRFAALVRDLMTNALRTTATPDHL